ncbi:hypothetical protein OIU84_010781 [Salix udensis]|uniref:Uncharacterized protein n=1 Tax=Salix udensis TaxID=889485 RepID=A0AAD6JLI9_9ROSI|nr:hypothetical protein OIU84_010781 [Salix udensis]
MPVVRCWWQYSFKRDAFYDQYSLVAYLYYSRGMEGALLVFITLNDRRKSSLTIVGAESM